MKENIDVRILQDRYDRLLREVEQRGSGGDEPPGGNGLDKRIEIIEKAIPDIRERLARVETKIDGIEKTMATKADLDILRGAISTDLHKAIGDQTWRFITVSCVLAGIAFTAARFIPGG